MNNLASSRWHTLTAYRKSQMKMSCDWESFIKQCNAFISEIKQAKDKRTSISERRSKISPILVTNLWPSLAVMSTPIFTSRGISNMIRCVGLHIKIHRDSTLRTILCPLVSMRFDNFCNSTFLLLLQQKYEYTNWNMPSSLETIMYLLNVSNTNWFCGLRNWLLK